MLPILHVDDISFLGYEIIFGKELANINPFNLGTFATVWLPFSWVALGAFLIPIISVLLVSYDNRHIPISFLLSLISIYLMLSLIQNTKIMYSIGAQENSLIVDWQMSYGLVIAIANTLINLGYYFYMFTISYKYNNKS
jgi:hypothetical protein